MNSKNNFIHLRNYTQYSLSKGAIKINDLINKCKKNKIPAVTISDFNNLFGCMEFSLECLQKGIQPIIGCNLHLKTKTNESGYVLLIAKNEKGFNNLSQLVSISNLENTNDTDTFITFENLEKFNGDLICLAGGEFGFITNNFYKSSVKKIDSFLRKFKDLFRDNFFLELQRINKKHFNYESYIKSKSQELKIPVVATNENFFLEKKFHKTHDALLSISQQKYIDSEDRTKSSDEYYFKSNEEMFKIFSDIPFVCENTLSLAKKCSFFLAEKEPTLPRIFLNQDEENSLLKKKSEEGLSFRLKKNSVNSEFNLKLYKKRLDYELDIIIRMGFSSYFLIVADFIIWAKNNNIPVGPGRGSGAGSLVAWCLSITNLNPIRFGLLFERFLNPDRVSLPDFDIDFCMDKRDLVIQYVQKKYGILNVAQIITFGSFQARAALRDVGRVMQIPLGLIDDICKMIPYNPANQISLSESFKDEKINKIIDNNPKIAELFEISINLEGLYRHASTHAAGIVISDKVLKNIIPLYKDPKSDIPVTQFSMKYVEKMGLIKFDFLGLKTLTVIQEACKYLNAKSIDIKIDDIPLDDEKTFQLLKNGDSTGLFQLEGQGMRETLKKVIPDRFEDIIAVVSLYRPGPMDNIPSYINRKKKKETYDYIHSSLKNILDETYGIMVYQEQVMLIAQKVAGFSLAKADLLRRAMGKKIKSEMQAQRSNFIDGCLKNKLDESQSVTLFNEIEKFAGYGFNKSHAAAYAMIAYQTAYLKANYPHEFFCALMNCDIGNFEKISNYCYEIKKLNSKIFNPDINESEVFFKVIYNQEIPAGIRYGLSAIKNIGENSINLIIDERKNNGEFKSILDFIKRVSNKILNKKIFESLVFSGAFNSLENNQNFLVKNIENILSYNVSYHKNLNKNQTNLFSDSLDNEQFNSESFQQCSINEKLQMEYESFGFYLSGHPTKFFKNLFENESLSNLNDLVDFQSSFKFEEKVFSSVCLITELRERTSKTGKKFCFLNLSDHTSTLDVICFSEVLSSINFDLKSGVVVLLRMTLQKMKDSRRYVVSKIINCDESKIGNFNYMISIDTNKIDHNNFKKTLNSSSIGNSEFFFNMIFLDHEIKVKSKKKFKVDIDFLSNVKKIKGVIGVEKIN